MRREETADTRKYTGVELWISGPKKGGYTPSDAALYLAIAYVWLSKSGYERWGKTAATEFERFQDFVLGYPDGIPKTPRWAARFTGMPSYVIKALAQHWGTEAFLSATEGDLMELVSQAGLLHEEAAISLNARYSGLPSTLIGGTVYDFELDEVIEGALVTVKVEPHGYGPGEVAPGRAELTVTSDGFGNFLVDGPKEGKYSVMVEKEGYLPKEWGPIAVENDRNLRDFAMFFDFKSVIWW
jgi:hypothetical protein